MAVTGGARRFGSAALDLAYVACGRSDLYWERDLQTWDIAAGIIIVREAGGFVTSADGGAEPLAARSVACGNEALHGELVKLLRRAHA
jgi:myo-inositol-1(or 4)-monophosphatase